MNRLDLNVKMKLCSDRLHHQLRHPLRRNDGPAKRQGVGWSRALLQADHAPLRRALLHSTRDLDDSP
jgi:hypothetical protein